MFLMDFEGLFLFLPMDLKCTLSHCQNAMQAVPEPDSSRTAVLITCRQRKWFLSYWEPHESSKISPFLLHLEPLVLKVGMQRNAGGGELGYLLPTNASHMGQ